MRFTTVLLFCLMMVSKSFAAFDYTPVLVHLSKAGQHDSLGFNLVEKIPALMYKKIMSGDITLWDGPQKQFKIAPDALEAIERSTLTKMIDCKDLFLNEIWRQERKEFEFNIIGFTFINESIQGQKVLYGFVDASELNEMLKSVVIETNANGPANLTYWDALYSKAYPFNIVQFGKNNFQQNMAESLQLQNDLFRNPKIASNAFKITNNKEIELVIQPGFQQNKVLMEALNQYLNANKEIFYNLGGNEALNYLNLKAKIQVSSISIIEIRTKRNGLEETFFTQVAIFVEGKPLKPLSEAQMDGLGITVELRSLKEYLSLHSYQYTLSRINHQEIYFHESSKYQQGLKESPWNQLTPLL